MLPPCLSSDLGACLPACGSVSSLCSSVEAVCQLAGASQWVGYSYPQTYLIALYSHREMINSPLWQHIQSARESYTGEFKRKEKSMLPNPHTLAHKSTHSSTWSSKYLCDFSSCVYLSLSASSETLSSVYKKKKTHFIS